MNLNEVIVSEDVLAKVNTEGSGHRWNEKVKRACRELGCTSRQLCLRAYELMYQEKRRVNRIARDAHYAWEQLEPKNLRNAKRRRGEPVVDHVVRAFTGHVLELLREQQPQAA